jgi:uncharacterized RDD family membrane protein YckC
MTNYAGFWRRFVAMCIDGLILIIPAMVLNVIIPFVGSIVLVLLYKPVFESSPLQGTPGKAMMGMMVFPVNGGRVTFKQALIRYAVSIVSGMILCIGYLMNLFTAKRQTLHDMVSETVVVYQEPPALDYFSVWRTEIKAIFDGLPTGSAGASTSTTSNNMASTTANNVDLQAHAIETLHKLFQSGAISQEEYEAKKQQLLDKIST